MLFLLAISFSVILLVYYVKNYIISVPKIKNIHEKYVFITGCGTGFGNKLAKRLDKLGLNVYAGCLLKDSQKKLNAETSPRLKTFQLDLTKKEDIENAFNFVSKDLGPKPLWAIVNNAAVPAALVPFDWTTVEDYENVLDVNLFGIIRATLKFLPLIKRGTEGRIINTSSMNARLNIMSNAYGVSKCALEALSDGLSYELKPFNITVHTLQPSIFKTNISDPNLHTKLISQKWERLDNNTKQQYGIGYKEKYIANIVNLYKTTTNTNLMQVVNAYEDAILSTKPINRYVVGVDAKLILFPLSLLPFSWQFSILPFIQKLSGLQPPTPESCI